MILCYGSPRKGIHHSWTWVSSCGLPPSCPLTAQILPRQYERATGNPQSVVWVAASCPKGLHDRLSHPPPHPNFSPSLQLPPCPWAQPLPLPQHPWQHPWPSLTGGRGGGSQAGCGSSLQCGLCLHCFRPPQFLTEFLEHFFQFLLK